MGILKLLIFFVSIAFISGSLGRFDFRNGIAISFLDISVGTIVIIWLLRKILKKEKIKEDLFLPILLFIATCFLSLLINIFRFSQQELIVSSLYPMRWFLYVLTYFMVKETPSSIKAFIRGNLLFVGLSIIIIGYVQFFFYQNLCNLCYLGWDDHLYRMFSTFLDPNYVGTFFSLFSIFITGLIFNKKTERKMKYLLIAIDVFCVLALYLTFSRGALIAWLFASTALFIVKKKKKMIIYLVVTTLIFLVVASPYFYLENVNPFRVWSSRERIKSAETALKIIIENPILGVGFNTYRYALIQKGYRGGPNALISHADAGTDNSFLFVLATTGIVGFFFYGSLLYKIFKKINSSLKKNNDIAPIVFASFIGVMINSLSINSLFYPSIMVWLWVLLGIMESK